MILLSIIIPVYNASLYLKECLDSVLDQSLKMFEIICVDDGSCDESGMMCDEYAAKYDCIKVIHQENRGPIGARMRGLRESSGKYITFVDADDFLDRNFYKELLIHTEIEWFDIILGGYVLDIGGTDERVFCASQLMKLSRLEAIKEMFERRIFDWSGCGKVYKRELFSSINDWWCESSYGEDTEMNWKLFNVADSILSVPTYGYHYRVHSNSLTRSLSWKTFDYFKRIDRIKSEINNNIYDKKLLYLVNHCGLRQAEWELSEFAKEAFRHFEEEEYLKCLITKYKSEDLLLYPYSDDIRSFCEKSKYIYIYGCGYYGQMVSGFLQSNNIDYSGFFVSKGHKTTEAFLGKTVYEYGDVTLNSDCGIIIAVKDCKAILDAFSDDNIMSNQFIQWYCV
jgi:glycosyltransferase involved in cell wall biosynthesis